MDAVEAAQRIKKTFVADFPEARRRQMDCTKAVYTAAALTLAVKELKAKGKKIKLNGAQLRDVCACKPKELGTIVAMMEAAGERARVKQEEEDARVAAAKAGAKADALADHLLATPSQLQRVFGSASSSKRGKDGMYGGGVGDAKRRKKSASSKKLDYEAWKKKILAGTGGAGGGAGGAGKKSKSKKVASA